MKKINFLLAASLLLAVVVKAQDIDKIINAAEVERIERVLSADDMQGRKVFTPALDKAAGFIADEFAQSNLKFFNGSKNYFQEFAMTKARPSEITGALDNEPLTTGNVAVVATFSKIDINKLSDVEVVKVNKGDDFSKIVFPLFEQEKNCLVLIDTSFARRFKSMQRFSGNAKFPAKGSQVLVLTANLNPTAISLHIKLDLNPQYLKNVVGILPGKSRPNELVIFSGHYDHLGIGKPNENQDSIYNGANDDAAGTTAVMMLARYFSALHNNERTLVFVAFTGEEAGGFGSHYFSRQIDPATVSAMFNIEMIGTESKWGTNSAYITGYEKSDMGKILQANLAGSDFHFEADPYPTQKLFYRSDNATLAEQGVPAHTISTSKMDSEKFYHTTEDEIETLDMNNMAAIIKAIALSSRSIISGKDTPSRIPKEQE